MRLLIYTLLAAVGIAGWLYLAPHGAGGGGFGFGNSPDAEHKANYGALGYGYFVTLVGVALGSLYRELQRRRADGATTISSFAEFGGSVFRSTDFWMGLCGSPLVYALLLQGIDSSNVAGLTVIALQNGFSCTIAIEAIVKGGPTVQVHTNAAGANTENTTKTE